MWRSRRWRCTSASPPGWRRPELDSFEVAFAGAARQADLIRARELSPSELVQLYLDRIARIDQELNSFRVVMAERALVDAQQAEARLAAGDQRPLLGVPVAVKDGYDVAGELTTLGTGAYGPPATQDCEMVRRLRAAGAIVIGKTLLPELAIFGFTESSTWGATRNPWDYDRVPGGSSGGSAAAVAAGLAPIATASDGAGSIRAPAACCGLVGLKPQRGRISLAPDPEHWYGLSVMGCLSRSVRDTALFLDVTHGAVPGDRDAPPPPPRPFLEAAQTAPGRLRVAVSTRPGLLGAPVHERVRRAVHDTAELLRSLGHDVRQRDPAYGLIGNALFPRFARGIHDDAERMARPQRLERRTRRFASLGGLFPPAVVARARASERAHAARINQIFDDHDVLLTATIARPPVEVGRWEGRGALWTFAGNARCYPFTAPWNVLGQPAMSLPAGFDGDDLPLSVQLVGRPNDEGTLLSLAAQVEAERPWADRYPARAR
jgi:amidase